MISKATEDNNITGVKSKHPLDVKMRTSASLIALIAMGVVMPATAQEDEDTERPTAVEEVLVTGQRASIQSAQAIKRNADQIVDSIVADDIGKLPDRSVTETLQRVPGVTIERFIDIGDPEHFSAEGSGVAIRGMTHVRSELNGRDSFSASGGRSLSFEDVPAELMAGVDVYKNPSADMIEGGLGGTVNLRTRMPFDSDERLMSFTASANYGDFIEETKPSVSGLYSDRWDTGMGEIGFLLDLAYSEISTRTDGVFTRPFFARTDIVESQTVWVPKGADWRRMDFGRKRLGTFGALQWRPNNNSEAYLTVFRSEYDMQWDEDAIFVQNDPWAIQLSENTAFNENGVFQSGRLTNAEPPSWAPQVPGIPFGADIRVSARESVTTDYAAGYKWLDDSGHWELMTDFQFTDSTTDTLDSTVATGVNLEYLDVDLSQNPPAIRTDSEYLADPTNYYWAFAMPHIEDSQADQFAWRADAEYKFEAENIDTFKFGIRFTDRQADNINTAYHWQGIFQTWMTTDFGGALNVNEYGMPYMQDSSDMRLNTFDNFFRGGADLEGVVWAPSLAIAEGYPESFVKLYADAGAYADAIGHTNLPANSNAEPIPFSEFYPYTLRDKNDPQWHNIQSEKTYAAYGLLSFGFKNLSMPINGNVGIRVVQTDSVSEGKLVYPDEAQFGGGASEDLTADNSYTNILPSLNLRMNIQDDLVARFALSQAMSRPGFNQMQAFTALEASQDTTTGEWDLTAGSWSNPNLRPLEANQADLSLEWYFDENGGMANINLFYKDIDGIIRNQTITEIYAGNEYFVTRPVNAGTAKIQGFEVNYTQFFDFLPAPFDGFGVSANYTYIDSSTDIPVSINPDDDSVIAPVDTNGVQFGNDLPYEGLSENAYNLVGMYEKGRISVVFINLCHFPRLSLTGGGHDTRTQYPI